MNKLSKAIRRHIPMKILSLVFAFIMWSYVLISVDPPRTRTVQDVDVTIQGDERLDSLGLIVVGDLTELFHAVDVDVTVKLSELEQIAAQKLRVTADLSSIRQPGVYQIDLSATTQIGDIAKISPATIEVTVEERVNKRVPVVIAYSSELDENLYIQEVSLETSTVMVYGRNEYVSQAVKAVCTIDQSTIVGDDTRAYAVRILNEAGEDITDFLDSHTETSTIVGTKVLAKKSMPLNLTVENVLRDVNRIAEGYELVGISYMPEAVEVVGDAEVLAQMETLTFDRISVRGLEETTEFVLNLSLPDGVTCITPFDVTVTVQIQKTVEPTEAAE